MKQIRYANYGEANGRAKLTVEAVRDIRESVRQRDRLLAEARRLKAESAKLFDAARQITNERLAKRYGVTSRGIGNVLYGENWRHVR